MLQILATALNYPLNHGFPLKFLQKPMILAKFANKIRFRNRLKIRCNQMPAGMMIVAKQMIWKK